jgi:hypothetical protein
LLNKDRFILIYQKYNDLGIINVHSFAKCSLVFFYIKPFYFMMLLSAA